MPEDTPTQTPEDRPAEQNTSTTSSRVFVIAAWATLVAALITAAQFGLGFWNPGPVDKRLVGTWELEVHLNPAVPNDETAYLWVQDISKDGRYVFTATGPPAPFSWSSDFSAGDGQWTLSGDYDDRGTYEVLSRNQIRMVGRLGPAIWNRSD